MAGGLVVRGPTVILPGFESKRAFRTVAELEFGLIAKGGDVTRKEIGAVQILDIAAALAQIVCETVADIAIATVDETLQAMKVVIAGGVRDPGGKCIRRLVRKELHAAAGGVSTEQRSLRAPQHFAVVDVIDRKACRRRNCDVGAVFIYRDRLLFVL